MPSEPAMTPDLPGKGLGARARGVLDLFFGYDFFISYAHADGGNYTLELSERLQSIGYKVFLDHHEYTAGEELNLLGLSLGLDLSPPALKLPGVGRIGMSEE